jgi:hypothetical protein
MKITLAELTAGLARLPDPNTCGGSYAVGFANKTGLEWRIDVGPPVFDIVRFLHDGREWQVAQETPITIVP